MDTSFYKKSGIIIMVLARDFYAMQPGGKIPTILEYTEKFSVSRGIVQDAIARLEEDGCIRIDKRGAKGTILVETNVEKLYPYTNWGSITGTMPIPLNPFLSSLTTAICEEMEEAPFPFSFAYVTGSEKRVENLKDMMYDFMVVSKSTALVYLEKYDFLKVCLSLEDCIYSPKFVIYFFNPQKKEIEDGMRVAIDPTSLDQAFLTKKLCEGKNVEFVKFPYIAFEDLVKQKKADCVVYRILDWCGETQEENSIVQIQSIEGFTDEETRTPVILTHKDNYGLDKLLLQYLSREKTREVQQEVLHGKKSLKFY